METMTVGEFQTAFEGGRRDFRGVSIGKGMGPFLEEMQIADADFSGASLDLHGHKVNFVRCKFSDKAFVGRVFISGQFDSCDFSTAVIGAHFTYTRVVDCAFSEATVWAQMDNCSFEGSTRFRDAAIAHSRFGKCRFSSDMNGVFEGAQFDSEVTMDLETFASLPRGALTSWQESAVGIIDDTLQLRRSFSGIKRGLYLLMLFLFLSPYVIFVVREWVLGVTVCRVSPCEPLYLALFDYAMQGGPITAITSIFVLMYQVVRTVLVVKASALEVESAARHTRVRFELGSPVFTRLSRWQVSVAARRFCFDEVSSSALATGANRRSWIEWLPVLRWSHLVWFLRYGLFVNLALLLVHAISFLRTPVP